VSPELEEKVDFPVIPSGYLDVAGKRKKKEKKKREGDHQPNKRRMEDLSHL